MNPQTERRIGIVSIIVYDPDRVYQKLNQILHDYSDLIIGRMGLPYRERNFSIIALIVNGTTDEIGALTGKLGQLESLSVKTSFAKEK
ncbi:iron-only hydrogenase system regulator [bacterium]|nr:iron-only hydrogenase system regulator [bacterium]